MTPDEINKAIAEACGWRKQLTEGGVRLLRWFDKAGNVTPLPDYVNDLNAMHEAEKVLTRYQCFDYLNALGQTSKIGETGAEWIRRYQMIRATAPQRAEAFLRTVGKWVDSQQKGNQ